MTAKLRNILYASGLAVVLIISALIVYGNFQHSQYLKSKGASAALTAEYTAYKSTAEPAILSLQNENATLRVEKQTALTAAEASVLHGAALQIEIDHLKTLTAALSPDGISAKINERIGTGSIVPTAGGLYICTRSGAEATLNRFLDGEGYKSKYESEQAVTLNLRAAVDAAERMAANSDNAFFLKGQELNRAILAWNADKDTLRHLERSILGRRTKSFIIGAASGAAAMLIYNLAKGK
jgi:hypothetical protein